MAAVTVATNLPSSELPPAPQGPFRSTIQSARSCGGVGRPATEFTSLAAYRIHQSFGFEIEREGSRGHHSGRESFDSRSLLSACEGPLKALVFRAFSDGVFRSLNRNHSNGPIRRNGALGSGTAPWLLSKNTNGASAFRRYTTPGN